MNRYIATAAAALTLLVLSSTRGPAAEVAYHSPGTVAAASANGLLKRGARAIVAYVAGCADRDPKLIDGAMTPDATVEYPTIHAGAYVAVDSSALDQFCQGGTAGRVNLLWLFPTNESDSLFAEYRVASDEPPRSDGTSQHLVLVTMRGDKIARLRDLTTVAATVPQPSVTWTALAQ